MQILMGERIKALRQRDGRKQDDLAIALGISNQAVSRWESDKGYPDIEMIPAIANYFHVTIDELFGYDNDRDIRLTEYLKRADEMNKPGGKHTKQSIEKSELFLREALKEFPNEWQLQIRLSVILQIKSSFIDKNQKAKAKSLEEAASLLKQAQKNTDDSHWKDNIGLTLAGIYFQLGDSDQIENIATENSPAFVCRELILTHTPDAGKVREYFESALLSLLHELANLLVGSRTTEQRISFSENQDLHLLLIQLIKEALDGKQYGYFHSDICSLYLHASQLMAREGKEKDALRYFDEAYEHLMSFKKTWTEKENHPTPDDLENIADYPGLMMFVDENVLREHLNLFPEKMADQIRCTPKYKGVLD